MFGIGFVELCVIIVVALVFVGPKKLPDLMKQAGKFFVQVRRMTSDVKSTMDEVIHEAEQEIRKEEREHLTKLIVSDQNKKETPKGPDGSESVDPRKQQDAALDGHHQENHKVESESESPANHTHEAAQDQKKQ